MFCFRLTLGRTQIIQDDSAPVRADGLQLPDRARRLLVGHIEEIPQLDPIHFVRLMHAAANQERQHCAVNSDVCLPMFG